MRRSVEWDVRARQGSAVEHDDLVGMAASEELDDLPASVREIAQVIGRADALRLIGQLPTCVAGRPGKRSTRVMLYVPKKLSPGSLLVQVLGAEKALALVREFGGEVMQPANCRRIYAHYRDEAIRKMLRDGARPAMVMSVMGVSERHVVNLSRAGAREMPQVEPVDADDEDGDDAQLRLELGWSCG